MGQGLFVVSADGGRPKALTTLDPGRFEIHHAFPQAVDGGRQVLFTVRTRSKEAPLFVDVFDVATQTRQSLVPGAQYTPDTCRRAISCMCANTRSTR